MPKPIAFILKHERKLLLAAILLYIAVFSGICLWKYGIFAYDGLDLAIYNQVFWNTAHGRLFEMSIHPHSYLGDHAELLLLPLSLIYALLPNPRTLLVLQTIALAAAAYPIWLIAKRATSNLSPKCQTLIPLLMALLWLLNPLVHNINLFEFHLLPFALIPLLFAYLAYEDGKKTRFILLALLSMLVREDVALVIAGFGILAAFERKSWWWRLAPIATGAAWFASAMTLVSHFAPDGAYKFAAYYSWLGATPTEMVANAALHPLSVLTHIVSVGNLEMLIGFGLPLLFLPYLAPRFLVLAAGPLLQILMGAPGGSAVVLETHYSTLFLPALFVAAIAGLDSVHGGRQKAGGRKFLSSRFPLPASRAHSTLFLLLMASVYGAFVLGPLPHAAARIVSGEDAVAARTAAEIISEVPPDASVTASYRLLPHLSSRERIYSNHYIFLGVNQFGSAPYRTPDDIEYVAFDAEDLGTYRTQFMATAWAKPHYEGGRARLAAVAGEEVARVGSFVLYESGKAGEPPSVFDYGGGQRGSGEDINDIDFGFADGSVLNGMRFDEEASLLELDWTLGRENNDTKVVRVTLKKDGEVIYESASPLINDLHQPVEPGSEYIQKISIPFSAMDLPPGRYVFGVMLSEHEAVHVLDGIRSTMEYFTESHEIGGIDEIGYIEL